MIHHVLLTGTVALATLLGPAAGAALAAPPPVRAADAAAPTLSIAAVRPGVSFTLTPPQSCPAADGEQVVQISFTDSDDTTYQLAAETTDDDGSWAATTVRLPVIGLDDTGSWTDAEVAAGAGTVDVLCLSGDVAMAHAGASSVTPDQREAVIDPPLGVLDDPDDGGDDSGDDDNVTLTYAPAPLTVTGNAAAVSVTPTLADSGDTVVVAPVDVCGGLGARTARIQISPATPGEDEDPGDSGDDGDEISGLGAEADPDAILTTEVQVTGGTWPATEVMIPSGTELGDYAVVVDCLNAAHEISSRYDAAPLALGTVIAGSPVCSANGAAVRVTGSYPGALVNGSSDHGPGVVPI